MAGPTPSLPSICCLPGYTYSTLLGLCINNINNADRDTPHPCACCPAGWTFIDGLGQFIADDLSVKIIVNPDPANYINTCARIVNMAWAMHGPAPINPIACPCCPAGYTYLSDTNVCALNSNPKILTDPIPCLPCMCVTPPPPPPCIGCQASPTAPISYTIPSNTGKYTNAGGKSCQDCDPQGEPIGLGGCADNFIPLNLTDPIINFKLDS